MPTRIKPLAALCTALMLLSAAPARAVEAPELAVGPDTLLMVWVDFEQVDAEMIGKIGGALGQLTNNPMLQQQGIGLPFGEINEMVANATAFRDGFIEAGGKGLMLSLEMPAQDTWSPPVSLFAATAADADAAAMAGLINRMSEGVMQAQATPLQPGWHTLAIWSADGQDVTQPLPEEGDKDAYRAFDKQLGEVKVPLLSVAFRMNDQVRTMMNAMGLGAGQAGQQDPQMAMAAGLLQLLEGLDTVGFAVSKDEESFAVDVQMVFLEPAQAEQFGQMYNALIMWAPALLAQQMQQLEDAPTPQQLNDFFLKLQMKRNGDTLKLKLDARFFEMAQELGPKLQGLAGPGLDL